MQISACTRHVQRLPRHFRHVWLSTGLERFGQIGVRTRHLLTLAQLPVLSLGRKNTKTRETRTHAKLAVQQCSTFWDAMFTDDVAYTICFHGEWRLSLSRAFRGPNAVHNCIRGTMMKCTLAQNHLFGKCTLLK